MIRILISGVLWVLASCYFLGFLLLALGLSYLLAFKKLPFHLAKHSGRAIVPVTIKGMFEINNKNSFMIRPGRVSLSFGAATDAAEYQDLSVVELRDRVEGRMRKTLENAGPA